jgi:hypothetical protein
LRFASAGRVIIIAAAALAVVALPTVHGTHPAVATSTPRILFGLGPTIDAARDAPLVTESPVRMLSAWYNGPHDLGWLTDDYHRSMYRRAYADGQALHLIVHVNGPEKRFSTEYGTACGRRYPMSGRFRADMRTLARAFGRSSGPPQFVTMFTEFQTYPCVDNPYAPNPNVKRYYRALRDRYAAAQRIFHRLAPNARVSIGWGGWQMRWDDPAHDGGRSMFSRFASLMRSSDFVSFQAMSGGGNIRDIRRMTRRLGEYGPVMLAHYKPEGANSGATFEADMRQLLTEDELDGLVGHGLFAIGFMDHSHLSADVGTYRFVRAAVRTFGAGPAIGP